MNDSDRYIVPCGSNHLDNIPEEAWWGQPYGKPLPGIHNDEGCGAPVQLIPQEFSDFQARRLVLIRCYDCCYSGGAAQRVYLINRTDTCWVCGKDIHYQCLNRSLSPCSDSPILHKELCPDCTPAPHEFHRSKILDKTDGRCAYCGRELTLHDHTQETYFNTEHVIPKSRGGPNIPGNIVAACKTCNSRKHSKTLSEFREWIKDQIVPDPNLILQENDWLRDFIDPAVINLVQDYYIQVRQLAHDLEKSVDRAIVTFELDRHDVDLFRDGA